MEFHSHFHFPSIPLLLTFFFIFIITILKTRNRTKSQSSTPNLPPSPWKLPLIGNIHNLISSELPHRRLRYLSTKYGSLIHLQLGEIPVILVSSPESAKQIMKIHDSVLAQRPMVFATSIITYDGSDIAFAPYGNYWRQMRKICTLALLTSKRVQSFRSVREQEVMKIVKSISSNVESIVNLSELLFAFTNSVTLRTAFGGKCENQREFVSLVGELSKLGGGFSVSDVFPSWKWIHWISGEREKVEKIHGELDRIIQKIIDEHKDCRGKTGDGEDLVDVLLNIQEHGDLEIPLTIDNIKAVILDMFIAGSETSSTVVDWAMSELMRNPTEMKKAQSEVRQIFDKHGKVDESNIHQLQYLNLIIKEILRLHPPLPLLLPRESRETCEIDSYKIPPNFKIIVNAWAIGRDPQYWTDPDRFFPERFLEHSVDYKGTHFEYIPSGAGRRICPEISFGMANVEIALAHLLFHFDWKLPGGMKPEDLDMSEAFGSTVRKKLHLCLIPTRYYLKT